jgi:repressor LexA
MVVSQRGIEARFEILDYITWYINVHGYPPTVRELSREVGLSVAGVHYHLGVLAADHRIERTPGVARGIRLLGA